MPAEPTTNPSGVPGRPPASAARRGLAAGLAVAAAVLAVGVTIDRLHFAHGVSVEWRARVNGEVTTIAETVEHDPRFRNHHRALARYVAGWTVAEHGIPTERPPLDAVVRSAIRIAPGASRGITARSHEEVEISVDGRPLAPTDRVAPGWHRLEVHWSGSLSEANLLELQWENGDLVPRSVFHPLGGSWPASRSGFWVIVLVLAAAFAGLALRAERPESRGLRRERWLHVVTLLVVVWGTGLRAWQYDTEPEPLENYDEYFNLWNGWSLLHDGTSRGWSAWPGAYSYEVDREVLTFWGTDLTVVSPYFENPPLMHLLVGAVTHAFGTESYLDCRVEHGRLVSLALSALTIWLLVLVGRRLTPSGPAPWLGALLYATTPTIVIQTRIMKEEMLVVPLALGALYFFLRWRDGRATRDLALAAVCAGLGVFAKIPAAMLVPGLAMLVFATGDVRAGARALVWGAGLGVILTLAYMLWQGPAAFHAASGAQVHGRGLYFNIYPRYFDVFLIDWWMIGRGWLLFLWLAALSTLYTWPSAKRAVVAVPLAVYVAGLGVAAGNYTHGWYLLPVVAYLSLAGGDFLAQLWERPDLMRGALFGLLFVMYTLNLVFDPSRLLAYDFPARPVIMGTVLFLLVPYCLVQIWPDRFRATARTALLASGLFALGMCATVVVRWEVLGPVFRDIDRHVYFP